LNESLFNRHQRQKYACHDCKHANEAKIELPRKTGLAGVFRGFFKNGQSDVIMLALIFSMQAAPKVNGNPIL
jgi:hypothetical protein